MGNLHIAMASGATALYLPFSGLTTTLNQQYQRINIDLCGCYSPNYFAILVPEMSLISKVCNSI